MFHLMAPMHHTTCSGCDDTQRHLLRSCSLWSLTWQLRQTTAGRRHRAIVAFHCGTTKRSTLGAVAWCLVFGAAGVAGWGHSWSGSD